MTFDVHTPSGSQRYTGNARYDVEHPGGGLLTVWTHDGEKVVYGPAGWHRLSECRTEGDDRQPARRSRIGTRDAGPEERPAPDGG